MHMTEYEKKKRQVVLKKIRGEITTLEAALTLGLTRRAIQIQVKKYNTKGDKSFIHGNRGRKRDNPRNQERKEKIRDILLNTEVDGINPFDGVTYTYFTEILNEYYGIPCSRTLVKNIMLECSRYTPIKHKAKKTGRTYMLRPPKESMGELVQADGTPYDWFGTGENYTLQGFVDDATGIPVGLYMTKNECTLGYLEALRYMLLTHGIPEALYPDKAGIFFVNNLKKKDDKAGLPEKDRHLTQFGYIMEELGVDMFPAHSPEAKGRIERFWQTVQHRLPTDFKMRGIRTPEEANRYIAEIFIPKFSKRFGRKPKNPESKFVPASQEQVAQLLKATFLGNTDKCGVFTLKGYRFLCPELPKQKIKICMSEKDGLWVTTLDESKKYIPTLVETDTSGPMPAVWQILIEKVFLKNAKPRFREVYYDIDDTGFTKATMKAKAG